jgi:hypothetical protein
VRLPAGCHFEIGRSGPRVKNKCFSLHFNCSSKLIFNEFLQKWAHERRNIVWVQFVALKRQMKLSHKHRSRGTIGAAVLHLINGTKISAVMQISFNRPQPLCKYSRAVFNPSACLLVFTTRNPYKEMPNSALNSKERYAACGLSWVSLVPPSKFWNNTSN